MASMMTRQEGEMNQEIMADASQDSVLGATEGAPAPQQSSSGYVDPFFPSPPEQQPRDPAKCAQKLKDVAKEVGMYQ